MPLLVYNGDALLSAHPSQAACGGGASPPSQRRRILTERILRASVRQIFHSRIIPVVTSHHSSPHRYPAARDWLRLTRRMHSSLNGHPPRQSGSTGGPPPRSVNTQPPQLPRHLEFKLDDAGSRFMCGRAGVKRVVVVSLGGVRPACSAFPFVRRRLLPRLCPSVVTWGRSPGCVIGWDADGRLRGSRWVGPR